MKLLIVTQVVDTEHPILGFFHRWVEEFAKHCEEVHVICLQEGKHNLPKNVSVYSLGKESGKGRIAYVIRFFSLIWKLRDRYDNVFVHMNQEYVLLGLFIWKPMNKPIYMWRNHYAGSLMTDVAASFCDRIFYTSLASYTKKYTHAEKMPIGLDPDSFFIQNEKRRKDTILYVGRISSSKRIDLIIDSLKQVVIHKPDIKLTLVGGPGSVADENYLRRLKEVVEECKLPVIFYGAVSWSELPTIYSQSELFINMSPPGMFDKVIGEAILCGCDVFTTNYDLGDILGDKVIREVNADYLASKLIDYRYNQEEVKLLRGQVVDRHSLDRLVKRVVN